MGDARRRVGIALGSNLGDRAAHLTYGVLALRDILTDLTVSTFIETAPQGAAPRSPPFLNAAVVGTCDEAPRALLSAILSIETARHRDRPWPGAPRTLDLDLILAGQDVIEEDDLKVPHPRFRERLFVLGPLAEIAPDLTDPITGRSVRQLMVAAVLAQSAGPDPAR